jgi:hypothetical protein
MGGEPLGGIERLFAMAQIWSGTANLSHLVRGGNWAGVIARPSFARYAFIHHTKRELGRFSFKFYK